MDVIKAVLDSITEVKKNILLLLSSDSGSPIKGKLWYQKELFLLAKNNKALEEELDFEPYFWGPHSELVEEEVSELVQLNVVKHVDGKFVLTDLGKKIAQQLETRVPNDEKKVVEDIKKFLNDLDKEELLLFIYISYPDVCEDAIELKNLLPKRKEIAIRLYKKSKISVGKAAELAGVHVREMISNLKESGIYDS